MSHSSVTTPLHNNERNGGVNMYTAPKAGIWISWHNRQSPVSSVLIFTAATHLASPELSVTFFCVAAQLLMKCAPLRITPEEVLRAVLPHPAQSESEYPFRSSHVPWPKSVRAFSACACPIGRDGHATAKFLHTVFEIWPVRPQIVCPSH